MHNSAAIFYRSGRVGSDRRAALRNGITQTHYNNMNEHERLGSTRVISSGKPNSYETLV